MTRDSSHMLFLETWKVTSHGWSFASAFPGPMTYLVASPTLASENSGVMHGASCAQRKISMVGHGVGVTQVACYDLEAALEHSADEYADSLCWTLAFPENKHVKYNDWPACIQQDEVKVIMDLKLKEEKDIDKMISIEKQLKFMNEIVYKGNQSIQTIHMLAPKGPTFNGRPTFANPMYLKKAQSKKPCLYEIPYDTSDPANRFVPDREETLTLEKRVDQN
ncbi:hypothetical protein Tco_0609269 [Tanacetum coccineum]